MRATYIEQVLHKSMYQSSIKDPAEIGHRTSICEETVNNMTVNNVWTKVTCPECLKIKGEIDNDKQKRKIINSRKRRIRASN